MQFSSELTVLLTTLRPEAALYTQVPPRTLTLVTHTYESHDLMTQVVTGTGYWFVVLSIV